MATLVPTSFTKYNLTQEEYIAGSNLSLQTQQVLQNLLADCAELKLNLIFDATNPSDFIQNEAMLSGKINILRELLDGVPSV